MFDEMMWLLIVFLVYFVISIYLMVSQVNRKKKLQEDYETSLKEIIAKQKEVAEQIEIREEKELDIDDKLHYTVELLQFIDSMIVNEIINEKRFAILLNQPDKNLDVDTILKDVSTKVFESLRPEIFSSVNNIVTAKYLLGYIQKKTFITYITYIQNDVASQLE